MNNFELIGRVNYIQIKYTDSGRVYTRVLLSKKRGENDYMSFPITFFNTKNSNTAEQISEQVHKGDYIRAKGKLDVSKFTTKDGKEVSNIDLIGFDFVQVEYSQEEGKYVEKAPVENDRYGTVERTPEPTTSNTPTSQAIIDDEEIPF